MDDCMKQDYLHQVASEIYGRKLKLKITKELSQLIDAQCESYLLIGYEPQTALMLTLNELGEPHALGKHFNQVHNPQPKWYIYPLVLTLVGFTYPGSLYQYLDLSTLLTLLPCSLLVSFLERKSGKTFYQCFTKSLLITSLIFSLFSFLVCLKQGYFALPYLRINLFAPLFSLTIYILFHALTSISLWLHKFYSFRKISYKGV